MAIQELLKLSKDYYSDRAPKEIEQNRKGTFFITLMHDGRAVDDAEISFRLKRHDYDFGCNIFMLDQYESAETNEQYLSLWKKLFNTAVVPLYWEGTEPKQGVLRYDADAPNDVYRRPPAARVIEYCKQNGITTKGHPLFWHEFIPSWLPEDFETLFPLIEKRFQEISERFADDIPVFDCVNEPSRIWDMCHEHRSDNYKMIAPPEGYVERIFALAEKYFPANELILNEATGAAFCDFRGVYSGYYQYIKDLLAKGVRIDRIGLQCHISDSAAYKNIFDARRLYGILDVYAALGKPLVLSEIGLSCDDEQLQAQAVEQLYTIWFSHKATNGIFWWNLDDNGILCSKERNAMAENLPDGGLCRNGCPKAVYKTLDRLINHEWTTNGLEKTNNGTISFRGFYGQYELEIYTNGKTFKKNVDFSLTSARNVTVEL